MVSRRIEFVALTDIVVWQMKHVAATGVAAQAITAVLISAAAVLTVSNAAGRIAAAETQSAAMTLAKAPIVTFLPLRERHAPAKPLRLTLLPSVGQPVRR